MHALVWETQGEELWRAHYPLVKALTLTCMEAKHFIFAHTPWFCTFPPLPHRNAMLTKRKPFLMSCRLLPPDITWGSGGQEVKPLLCARCIWYSSRWDFARNTIFSDVGRPKKRRTSIRRTPKDPLDIQKFFKVGPRCPKVQSTLFHLSYIYKSCHEKIHFHS